MWDLRGSVDFGVRYANLVFDCGRTYPRPLRLFYGTGLLMFLGLSCLVLFRAEVRIREEGLVGDFLGEDPVRGPGDGCSALLELAGADGRSSSAFPKLKPVPLRASAIAPACCILLASAAGGQGRLTAAVLTVLTAAACLCLSSADLCNRVPERQLDHMSIMQVRRADVKFLVNE